nr:hypothetical protein [Actinomycetota bacterium]
QIVVTGVVSLVKDGQRTEDARLESTGRGLPGNAKRSLCRFDRLNSPPELATAVAAIARLVAADKDTVLPPCQAHGDTPLAEPEATAAA